MERVFPSLICLGVAALCAAHAAAEPQDAPSALRKAFEITTPPLTAFSAGKAFEVTTPQLTAYAGGRAFEVTTPTLSAHGGGKVFDITTPQLSAYAGGRAFEITTPQLSALSGGRSFEVTTPALSAFSGGKAFEITTPQLSAYRGGKAFEVTTPALSAYHGGSAFEVTTPPLSLFTGGRAFEVTTPTLLAAVAPNSSANDSGAPSGVLSPEAYSALLANSPAAAQMALVNQYIIAMGGSEDGTDCPKLQQFFLDFANKSNRGESTDAMSKSLENAMLAGMPFMMALDLPAWCDVVTAKLTVR
ncbi:MAG: hypothetical protein AAF562_02965 [Pseudomonadota bacterium]